MQSQVPVHRNSSIIHSSFLLDIFLLFFMFAGAAFTQLQALRRHVLNTHTFETEKIEPKAEPEINYQVETVKLNQAGNERNNINKKNNRKEFEKKEYYNKSFNCLECDMSFSHSFYLKKHLSEIHKEDTCLFRCDKCDKLFVTQQNLRLHIEKRHDITCKRCLLKLESEEDLEEHLKTHEGDTKNYKCRFCNKQFPLRNRLLPHMRVIDI